MLGRGDISHIVKMHYFFKNFFLYTQLQIRQTEIMVMLTNENSTKIVNFIAPGAGILVLRHGHIVQSN